MSEPADMDADANGKSISTARRSSWEIIDMTKNENVAKAIENEFQNHQQQFAAKVHQQRQSQRLFDRQREAEKENEAPPSKKARGRPRKYPKENEKQSTSKTGSDTGIGTQAAASSSSPTDQNADNGFDIGIKAKSELTKLILGCYTDFRNNPEFKNRFSAKCNLCDDQEDRIKFLKGNNTNLKSHLERVM